MEQTALLAGLTGTPPLQIADMALLMLEDDADDVQEAAQEARARRLGAGPGTKRSFNRSPPSQVLVELAKYLEAEDLQKHVVDRIG